MRVLIVEDESAAYDSLVQILKEIDPSIAVVGNTESVQQTIDFLHVNPEPDLIIMDIHLSDGSSFLIFEKIRIETPIIFTTAYDKYAIEAFKVNSIDYLLKPIKPNELAGALQKFRRWTKMETADYLSRLSHLAPTPRYKDKLLIPVMNKLHPINLWQVSFFYTTDKNTRIYLKDGTSYSYARTLEQIITLLNPADYYRANKQYIIARDSVKEITIWFDNRLLVTLDTDTPERLYISKNKAAEFKAWIVND